jgi:lipopolysaccharide export LptBFGC system permease protein LptF
MTQILSRYVAVLFLQAALLFSTGLILLASVIDFAVRIKQFLEMKIDSPAGFVAQYYLYKIPFLMPFLLPPALLMAAAFTLIRLARANEIVPILMGGRSMRQVCAPFLAVAAAATLLTAAVEEYVLPAFGKEMNLLEERAHRADLSRAMSARSVTGDLIFAKEFDWSTLTGRQVQITLLDANGQLAREIIAETAQWRPERKEWFLTHGYLQDFVNGRRKTKLLPDGSEALDRTLFGGEGYALSLMIEPAQFTTFSFYSSYRPFEETRELVRRYPNVMTYRSQWYQRFLNPFTSIVLMLLGLPVIATVRSKGSFFVGATLCFFVVMAYFGIVLLVQTLGLRGALSLELASFGPPALFALFGAYRYATLRT